jgi:hypothetical protein
MLFVEDVFALIAARWTPDAFDGTLFTAFYADFIDSVSRQLSTGRALSEPQSKVVVAMIAKVGTYLVAAGDLTPAALDTLLRFPQYRRPPYASVVIRNEVRLLGGYFLGFRFKYNEKVQTDLRALAHVGDVDAPWFHHEARIWIVPVMRWTLQPILDLIATCRFQMDTATRDYLTLARCSRDKPSTLVYHASSNRIVANICDNALLTGWVRHVAGGTWV